MSDRETTYVCAACGKTADSPHGFTDVSCAIGAVKCFVDSLEYADGRVIKADAAPRGGDDE